MQGEVGLPPLHICSPGDDPSSLCHATNTGKRSASQQLGAVFPTGTQAQTDTLYLAQTAKSDPNHWLSKQLHPAEAHKPGTGPLPQEMGHAA